MKLTLRVAIPPASVVKAEEGLIYKQWSLAPAGK
jgi:hypothetical protein